MNSLKSAKNFVEGKAKGHTAEAKKETNKRYVPYTALPCHPILSSLSHYRAILLSYTLYSITPVDFAPVDFAPVDFAPVDFAPVD